MNLVYNSVINSLSMGNVSYNLLKEMYKQQINPVVFPMKNNIDFKPFTSINKELLEWFKYGVDNRFKLIRKEYPSLKLWHLNGAENKYTDKQFLYTFHETDTLTPEEITIAGLQEHVFVSSSHSEQVFKSQGVDNCTFVPLGFDSDFHQTTKKYMNDDVVHFGLMGKWEKRKHTEKIIQLWAKKYGNNRNYQLTCCVTNPFYKPEDMTKVINASLDKKYFNINFIPYLDTNAEINDLMNAIDIDLTGLSGGEGWNLPAFNCTCLGKWSIVLNATAHKDWATKENSILVEPTGKEELVDDIFFKKGSQFNQGNYYVFKDEDVISAFEQAEKIAKTINTEGEKLPETFNYSKTFNKIQEVIKEKCKT